MSKEPVLGAKRGSSGLLKPSFALNEWAPFPMATTEGAAHLVRFVNPAFCRLMNKTDEQLTGKPFRKMLPAKDKCVKLLDRVYRTGKPETHTEQQQSSPQPVFWSYTMWPVMAGKSPIGAIILVTESAQFHETTLAMNQALMLGSVRQHELTDAADSANAHLTKEIDERKQVEEALQKAQKQLTDRAGQLEGLVTERTSELTGMNTQMEAFVYSVAHDLRAPLRAMQGFSAMLMAEAGQTLSDVGKGYATRIMKSALFMDELLSDMLAFSRVSQQHIELAPVNLGELAESVLSRLQNEIQDKQARVEMSGIWPAVLGHQSTLSQVLFNLVSNALKFSKPGVPALVRLRTEERSDFIRLWVEDNGIGIAPAHREQAFRLFTRLNGEKYQGTGVGLAIVQKGIERMGGRTGVESSTGLGSSFWFELRKAVGK